MIETERLILRRPRVEDIELVCALWADPIVTRHISGQPLARRQAWMNLLSMTGHWAFYGYGGWIVEERDGGEFIGQIGFQKFERGIDPSREDRPEAGWVLSPKAHGRGYATEAVRAIVDWADRNLAAASTVAIISDENGASIGVARKVGYREITRTRYLDSPITVFERPRGG